MSGRGYNARDRSRSRGEGRPRRGLRDQLDVSRQQEVLQNGSGSISPQCVICSFKQAYPNNPEPVHHRHFSSVNLREILGIEQSGKGHFCPSCKSPQRPYLDDRLKVLISDSTLHDVFAMSDSTYGFYEGDLVHCDHLTIAGGSLPELLHAFKQEYVVVKRPRPLDVVLVAVYADVVNGFSREFIHWGFSEFAKSVLELGEGFTFAIASMMYPPSKCWFSDDGPPPYMFHNHLEKFDWLNKKIHEINLHNNVPGYPCFHSYGTRKTVVKEVDKDGAEHSKHVRVHRWEHWSEYARRDKFTLRLDRKFKLAKAVNNYFLHRT